MINNHLIVSPLFVKVCEKLQNNIQMFRVWLDFTENTTTGKKKSSQSDSTDFRETS